MFQTRLLAPDERPILAPLIGDLFRHYDMPVPDEPALARALAEQPPSVEMIAAIYRRIGARLVEEKVYFRLDEEGIAKLAVEGGRPR